MEPSTESVNVQDRKEKVEVRNALGWGNINELTKWLNPGGNRDSLCSYGHEKYLMEEAVKIRNALGWGKINAMIKWLNPGGKDDSLVPNDMQDCVYWVWNGNTRVRKENIEFMEVIKASAQLESLSR